MTEYDDAIYTYSEMCDDIQSEQVTCRAEYKEIFERIDFLDREQQEPKESVYKSDRTIIDLQCRSMRDNLIFTGISEHEYDNKTDEPEPENF